MSDGPREPRRDGEAPQPGAELLRQSDSFAQAVYKLAGSYAISPRQAYRYLHQAERLKAPVPVVTAKIPFTVKLPENLVKRLGRYVKRSRSTLSEGGSQTAALIQNAGTQGYAVPPSGCFKMRDIECWRTRRIASAGSTRIRFCWRRSATRAFPPRQTASCAARDHQRNLGRFVRLSLCEKVD
jgi:hypothetical protein